jgi:hypothetical protein
MRGDGVGSGVPVDPVEPVPVEPVSVDPVVPVEPVPVEPVDPVEPVEPVDPVEPSDPVEPVDPVEPDEPDEPVEPEPDEPLPAFELVPDVHVTEFPSADRVQFICEVVEVVGVVVGVVFVTTVVVGESTNVLFVDRDVCREPTPRRGASACARRTAASYVAFAARYCLYAAS